MLAKHILRTVIFALPTLLLALPASARDLNLGQTLAQSDVVVIAQVLDPRNEVADFPIRGAAPYQRLIRLYSTVETLKGRAPAKLRVDDARWRLQLQTRIACGARQDCQPAPVDRYRGNLAGEPKPGDRVLLFLRRTHDGLELAADLAIDAAGRAAEVRAPAPAAGRRGKR